jgi:pimeloyl-ACP methyl ester carboxylesterase
VATQPDESKPTIVLVHGAWADATGFDAEIRALQGQGFRAIGFANPLRDLAADSAYLAEFLASLTGPIVLVGHSYGGNVISVAATGNDQVKALVYLNGWMCDEGESQQELLERFEGSLVGPSIRPVPFTSADGSEGADLFLAPEAFREAFAADVDEATADVMAAAQRPCPPPPPRTPPPRSPARRLARWRGRRCRAGTCSAPRTRRSRRRSSGSWPNARTRRSWRWRPLTSRSCRSPTPRPSSSFRPSRRPCPRGVAPRSPPSRRRTRRRNPRSGCGRARAERLLGGSVTLDHRLILIASEGDLRLAKRFARKIGGRVKDATMRRGHREFVR